jgi:hypothetical protein
MTPINQLILRFYNLNNLAGKSRVNITEDYGIYSQNQTSFPALLKTIEFSGFC